jgi:serine/threonine-protein kinase
VQLPIGRLREAAAGTAVNPVGAAAQPGARILIEQDDRGLASLPLAVAATAMGIPPTAVQMPPGGGLRMGELRFDLGPDRRFYPLAGGAGELPVYSAADVLAREVAATELRGRAVIIGALTGDAGGPLIAAAAVASPLDLAAALQGLLSQRYVRIEDWYFGAQRALLLALALLLVLPPARYVAGGAGIAVSLLLGLVLINAALVALLTRQFWLPVTLGVGFLWGAHLLLIGLARLEAALGRWRHEASEARRLLGLNLQAQGQLDQAFEALSAIPATESVVHHLYDLGLDYERRRQFSRALTVYEHISARRPKYRDIAARSTRLRSVTSPSPLAGADGGGNASATLVLSDSGLEKPRIGRYEVEAQIGRGAMGIVYLGRDPKIGRQVAIKALNLAQEFDAEELEEVKMRFYREAEASGRLNHPGIVQVYDIGEEHDLAYIAMDYVQGEPLDRHTRPGSLLAVEAVLEIGSQVAEALDYAHGQQVIHRDIKPANIMYESESGVAKLTDFGIACLTDNANTRTGTLIGTPAYMSPEQVAGKRVDGRSDLFSLGSTLFQLLVGRLPFSGESMANLVYKIGGEAHPKARSLRPELTAAIERVLDTALAKAPEDRYESGAAMAAALRKALSGWQGRGKKAAEQTHRR